MHDCIGMSSLMTITSRHMGSGNVPTDIQIVHHQVDVLIGAADAIDGVQAALRILNSHNG
jgi:hypothetical protein